MRKGAAPEASRAVADAIPILFDKITTVEIGSIAPHPRNPRQGDVGAIVESIRANGVYRPLIVQKSTRYILAGSHTWQAQKAEGMTSVPVLMLDVDDATALRILLVDNRTNDLATYDDSALVALLTEFAQSGGLTGTGFDGDALDDLLAKLNPPTLEELAQRVGKLTGDDLWPEIKIKVPPEVYSAFNEMMRTMAGETDAQRFTNLLARAKA